jgi:uncharacterized protein (DUF2267 family)
LCAGDFSRAGNASVLSKIKGETCAYANVRAKGGPSMTTGLPVFDATIQETNLWLKEVGANLGDCERQEAYVALRAVLHTLRDRLPAQAAVKFAAQLPMLLRGLYFEGWTLPEKPDRTRTLEAFADTVNASLHPRFRFDPITISEAVFATIGTFMSEGEAGKVMAYLPEPVRELWPQQVEA